jgi:hypothetical protein
LASSVIGYRPDVGTAEAMGLPFCEVWFVGQCDDLDDFSLPLQTLHEDGVVDVPTGVVQGYVAQLGGRLVLAGAGQVPGDGQLGLCLVPGVGDVGRDRRRGVEEVGASIQLTGRLEDVRECHEGFGPLVRGGDAPGERFRLCGSAEGCPQHRQLPRNHGISPQNSVPVQRQPAQHQQRRVWLAEHCLLREGDFSQRGGVAAGDRQHPIMPGRIGRQRDHCSQVADRAEQPEVVVEQVFRGLGRPAAPAVLLGPLAQAPPVLVELRRTEHVGGIGLQLFVGQQIKIR